MIASIMLDTEYETLVQCLVFALDKSFESFVLIPSASVEEHSNVCQFFTQNNITILTNDEEYPVLQEALERGVVEVLEILAMSSACDRQYDGTEYEYLSATTPYLPVAVDMGNEKLVTQLLNTNVAIYDSDFYSDIDRLYEVDLFFIDDGNADIMNRLLSFRANIRYKNPLGGTILHWAVRRGIEFLVQLLLKHGVNIDAVNNNGSTALHLAVELELPCSTASLLVQTGKAAVDVRQKDGSTSLLLAVKKGRSNVVSMLLRNNADVNIGNSDGFTPLHAAVMRSDQIVAEELLKHSANIDATVSYCHAKGVTPLCIAVEAGNLPMVQFLLDRGANLSIPCYCNETIVQLAVDRSWNVDMVECLLKHLPDRSDGCDKKLFCRGATRNAIRNNKTCAQLAKLLTEHGFSIDVEERDETEVLLAAIEEGDDVAVKRLLESGADVNRVLEFNYDNTMPLFRAIERYENGIVKLLISYGADVNAKLDLHDERTPLHKAYSSWNAEAAMILLAQNANVTDGHLLDGLLCLIASENNPEWEDVLLRRIQKNVSISELLNTFTSCEASNIRLTLKIVEILANLGAIDIRDCNGETAIHLACRFNMDPQVVKYLVQNCADVEARNFKGETPLLKAVWTEGEYTSGNVTQLLQYGAKINATNYSSDLLKIFEDLCCDKVEVFEYFLQFNFADTEFIRKITVNKLFSENSSDVVEERYRSIAAYTKSAKILAEHMVKLKAVFSHKEEVLNFCCGNNLRLVSIAAQLSPRDEDNRRSYLLDFQHQCEEEIMRLKNHRIGDSCASYYDVLTKNVQSVSCYLKNPNILEILESKHYESDYPIYAKIMSHQFEKGRFRRELLNQGLKLCHLLAGVFSDLPLHLKEKVLGLLSNRELEVAVYACNGILNRK